MKTKKRIVAVIMSALCVAALATGCGKVNIGYIDQSRIQNEAPQIKSSIEEMQNKLQEVQQDGDKQLQEAQAKGTSEEEMQKLQQQQQYSTQIKSKVDAALDDVVKAKKLDTVVNSNGKDGVVVSGGTDITDEVIQKLQ